MPAPTFEQLMAASRTQLNQWFESPDQETAEAAEVHLNYREALETYAEEGGDHPTKPPDN